MFKKGISGEFVQALKNWKHWPRVINDSDLFVGIRNNYINIYFQGCSLFKISCKNGQLIAETHYKYLVRPNLKNPYVSWDGDSPAIGDRVNEILIDKFDIKSLKKSSSYYAGAEKEGVHSILRSNSNFVDVEIALSPDSELETDDDDPNPEGKSGADRIDFAAIQRKDSKPCIVFFEAKRFDNCDLRSQELKPAVIEQIERYENFIKTHLTDFETSYRRVCKNLVDLTPDRIHPLVKEAADSPDHLMVDSDVRLVIFDYDADQDVGMGWKRHRDILSKHFESQLLMKGIPSGFTQGIRE